MINKGHKLKITGTNGFICSTYSQKAKDILGELSGMLEYFEEKIEESVIDEDLDNVIPAIDTYPNSDPNLALDKVVERISMKYSKYSNRTLESVTDMESMVKELCRCKHFSEEDVNTIEVLCTGFNSVANGYEQNHESLLATANSFEGGRGLKGRAIKVLLKRLVANIEVCGELQR